ncbi:MAG TPA: hypothetical protein DEO40_04125 [Treponema sp.]|nr:hypothetical protein [Treponema sp.]
MKKRLLLIFMLISASLAFCSDGLLWGKGRLRTISTEWFDIIFPPECEETAQALAKEADTIYVEICRSLGTSPSFRMPVTITPATDVFNAYYSNFSVNHIVLYDTLPGESLSVFESALLGTFRHELTHAVTINMRSPFWRAVDSVLGDVMNFGCYVTMPSMIKEGASVAEESRSGKGRLHDGFYLHTFRQAKLQGKFPTFADVTGARDTYPAGLLPYAFGGPFTEWLQEKYGMEKYAEFWYEGINMHAVTYGQAFKRAYGTSLSSEWKEFRESIFVPDVPPSPEDAAGISFAEGLSSKAERCTSISSGGGKLLWVEDSTGNLMCREKDGNVVIKSAVTGLQASSISNDGRYAALDVQDSNHPAERNRVRLIDLETGKQWTVPGVSLRDSCIAECNGNLFLCAVEVKKQNCSLVAFRINRNEKGLSSSQDFPEVFRYSFPHGAICFSPVDAFGGDIAFLAYEDGKWSLCILPLWLSGGNLPYEKVRLPDGISLRDLRSSRLSSGEKIFTFSWAGLSTFPRLGIIRFSSEGERLFLLDTDISGGVYSPAVEADSQNLSVFYIADLFTERRIMRADISSLPFAESRLVKETASPVAYGFASAEEQTESVGDFVSKPWHGPFFTRGVIAPFSMIDVYSYNGTKSTSIYFPGVSWFTSSPWDGTAFIAGAGVNPGGGFLSSLQDRSFLAGAMAKISGGTSTPLFKYNAGANIIFDSRGIMQGSFTAQAESTISFAGKSFLYIKDSFVSSWGRESQSVERSPDFFMDVRNSLVIQIGVSQKTGPGYYEKALLAFQFNYDSAWLNVWVRKNRMNLTDSVFSPAFVVTLPKIIPVDCAEGFTYNLPLKLRVFLAPQANCLVSAAADTVIFSAEIQKGLTFFPLYFNRIVLEGGYQMGLYDETSSVRIWNLSDSFASIGRMKYIDAVHLSLVMQATINTGALANPLMMGTVGVTFTYYPHYVRENPFAISLATSLNL